MAAKMWVFLIAGTMKLFFFATGQIGMKFEEKNINRCALSNLNRKVLKNFDPKPQFWGCREGFSV